MHKISRLKFVTFPVGITTGGARVSVRAAPPNKMAEEQVAEVDVESEGEEESVDGEILLTANFILLLILVFVARRLC